MRMVVLKRVRLRNALIGQKHEQKQGCEPMGFDRVVPNS